MDVLLGAQPVADQVRYRDHFQTVLPAEGGKLRNARHRAVVVHDFADDAGRCQIRQPGQIHGGFGLSRPHQYPAFAGAQRKHVAGPHQVSRARGRVDGGANGGGAVSGGDAGGDAVAGIDGFAEGGSVGGGIVVGHGAEAQVVAALGGERDADQAPAVLGHEVDLLRCDFLCRDGEVAFVFAVLVVHDDNHAALADFLDGFFDGRE